MLIASALTATKSITTDQAVGAVLRAKKQAQTILVLSKSDLVNEKRMETLILHRINGHDEAFNRCGFKCCVAVRCRDQKKSATGEVDEYALIMSEQMEVRSSCCPRVPGWLLALACLEWLFLVLSRLPGPMCSSKTSELSADTPRLTSQGSVTN